MDENTTNFLGRGWAFPPAFGPAGPAMTDDEADIQTSLRILFGTRPGERPLFPTYGLDLSELQFEPLQTTLRSLLIDRIRTGVLVHEPRIRLLELTVDDSQANEGVLRIQLDYAVRSTNSRFNLVYPFYLGDANEHPAVTTPRAG